MKNEQKITEEFADKLTTWNIVDSLTAVSSLLHIALNKYSDIPVDANDILNIYKKYIPSHFKKKENDNDRH